jgi:carbamate kinase
MIGYLLAQELMNQLPHKKIIVLLTQVEVDSHDPAFLKPTKFIGPVYTRVRKNGIFFRVYGA